MFEKRMMRGKKIASMNAFCNRIKSKKWICYSSDLTINGKPTEFYDEEQAAQLPVMFVVDGIGAGHFYEVNEA